MRAAPAFQVSLRRFGVWRGAVLTVAILAMTTMAAWLSTQERPIGIVAWLATGSSIAVAAALAARAARVPPVDLGWDGQTWSVRRNDEPAPGELHVAIDLGRWMLLRFIPAAPAGAPAIWLPVQRSGLESQWHALRCAVYAPRPIPGADATGEA
ncbi:MAG TPA: hypothetical protein VNU48_03440 [Burkholderiaceae bacterium]|nr:hypothetical protein [Burkholderiaceae bacterium]